jgi:negative regulator of sigma E activity
MENKSSNPGESLWRGKLSAAERAALRAQPELELEARLTTALDKIPDARMPSNFTARVLQAVEREESRPARGRNFTWNWRALLPRVAVTAAVVFFAGLTLHQHELTAQRTALARNVALVAGAQPLPSVEALKNFDAIRRMGQPRADDELLTLLQ